MDPLSPESQDETQLIHVTFEDSFEESPKEPPKVYDLNAQPFGFIQDMIEERMFEGQPAPLKLPYSAQQFQAYMDYMNQPFTLENFDYRYLVMANYLEDERFGDLVQFYRQQILWGRLVVPDLEELSEEYLVILFDSNMTDKQTYRPGQIGALLEQEKFRLSWERLFRYFPLRSSTVIGFYWKVILLIQAYDLEPDYLLLPQSYLAPVENDNWLQEFDPLMTFEYDYLDWAVVYGLLEVVKYLARGNGKGSLTREVIRSYDNRALGRAAYYGHLKLIRYFKQAFQLTREDVQTNSNEALQLAIQNGHLDIAYYLMDEMGLNKADFMDRQGFILALAAEKGQLEIIKYVDQRWGLTISDVRSSNRLPLRLAAKHNQLETIQYFVEKFKPDQHHLTKDDILDQGNQLLADSVLVEAAGSSLELVQYLEQEFDLTPDDIRGPHSENEVLIKAASQGDLAIVKYLVQEFHLTAQDVRAQNNEALFEAVTENHLAVVRYLHQTFGLTSLDAQDQNDQALTVAAMRGHLEIIQYLYHEMRVTYLPQKLIFWAAERGQLTVIKYLATLSYLPQRAYNPSPQEIIIYIRRTLINAASRGYVSIVKFLMEEYNLTMEDFLDFNQTALIFAARGGHLEIFQYLFEDWGWDPAQDQTEIEDAIYEAELHHQTQLVDYLKTFLIE